MRIRIHWRPELPGIDSSTSDEEGLRILFGDAEARRILDALSASHGQPITLRVSGPDAGFLDHPSVHAEFSILEPRRP